MRWSYGLKSSEQHIGKLTTKSQQFVEYLIRIEGLCKMRYKDPGYNRLLVADFYEFGNEFTEFTENENHACRCSQA